MDDHSRNVKRFESGGKHFSFSFCKLTNELDGVVKGDICVRLGVDTSPVTAESVSRCVDLIKSTAASLDLYHKMMSDMEELIQKNIREAEEQLMEERHLQVGKIFLSL